MNEEPRNLPLILASGSAARHELLTRLGLEFQVKNADIDESAKPDESPIDLVHRLALEKAVKVADSHPASVIIGSDQVALFQGEVTGKPGTLEAARESLLRFSGKSVEFLTGVVVLGLDRTRPNVHLDRTRVLFRTLGEGEIERYLAHDQPLACAGSFKIESLGPALFDSVESVDPTGLQGLPLIALAGLLRKEGFSLP